MGYSTRGKGKLSIVVEGTDRSHISLLGHKSDTY